MNTAVRRSAGKAVLAVALLSIAGPPDRLTAQRPASGRSPAPLPAPVAALDTSWLRGMTWRQIGPFRGGRVDAVVGDPKQPLVFYFGATGGGVWKTTDGG